MDRNTIIGFVLLAILLFLYLFVSTRNSQELQRQKQLYEDSVASVKMRQHAMEKQQDTSREKSATPVDTSGFNKAFAGVEQFDTVENGVMKIVFTNKGGQPKEVLMKNFNAYDGKPVRIVDPGANNTFSYTLNTGPNQTAQSASLFFDHPRITRNPDSSLSIDYRLPTPGGESLTHHFLLRPRADYLLDWEVRIDNPGKLFSQDHFNLVWHAQLNKIQQTVAYEKRLTDICFSEDNNFDYISRNLERTFDKPVQWLSISQQFFNATLIAKESFSAGSVKWNREASDSSSTIAEMDAIFQSKIPSASSTALAFQVYYGPNDYQVLAKQAPGMAKIIDLGRGVYSFVRPVNVYIIMPVFDFFLKFISSYGLAIMLLTIFIRLLTSPLVYTSYLSGAKMKALRPEIEAMKKRVGNDQQQVGVEQMKLFREAGVNPLGGCIPALLQIPIFFALYSFFNSNIALRGQHFLWSKDLSSSDSIVNFGFTIPLLGWDHVSLFALLAVVTSFLISLYGMNMTPDQSNPAMKYMPYFMPLILLFIFNNLPSALTWYYTVSNVITLILQWVIQNYIIDHDKILAKLQANRSKPKTKPKWQDRLEQMQETQKKIQQMKGKK